MFMTQILFTNKWTPRDPPSPVEQGPSINPIFRTVRRLESFGDESLVRSFRGFSELFECVSVPTKLNDELDIVAN
jgi:hypothetical protein